MSELLDEWTGFDLAGCRIDRFMVTNEMNIHLDERRVSGVFALVICRR
ncbi:hypothetical protein [Paractinoplanes maris]|nr:hypothetical protein [Actinoplanes maris]